MDKDLEQKAKVTEAVMEYNRRPTPENSAKFLVELAKLGIVWSDNNEDEKATAKDWADLSYELLVSRNYDKARALFLKLILDVNNLIKRNQTS